MQSLPIVAALVTGALVPLQLASRLGPMLGRGSVVLNISSWLGSIGEKAVPGHYGYAGSKALLNMFTKGASLELEKEGRSIVALNPGWMRTSMGGENAERTPIEVASDILALHDGGTLAASNGRFLNVDGSEHPG